MITCEDVWLEPDSDLEVSDHDDDRYITICGSGQVSYRHPQIEQGLQISALNMTTRQSSVEVDNS